MTETCMYARKKLDKVEGFWFWLPVSLTHLTFDNKMTPIKLLPGEENDLSLLDKGYVRKHIVTDIRADVQNSWDNIYRLKFYLCSSHGRDVEALCKGFEF